PPRAELKDLLRIRDHIGGRLRRIPAESPSRPVLEDALRRIDDQIAPDMRRLLDREAEMADYLEKLDRGTLPLPEQPYLERVKAIRQQQRATIVACVRAAANSLATLVAILQAGDDEATSERARSWTEDLDLLHEAI